MRSFMDMRPLETAGEIHADVRGLRFAAIDVVRDGSKRIVRMIRGQQSPKGSNRSDSLEVSKLKQMYYLRKITKLMLKRPDGVYDERYSDWCGKLITESGRHARIWKDDEQGNLETNMSVSLYGDLYAKKVNVVIDPDSTHPRTANIGPNYGYVSDGRVLPDAVVALRNLPLNPRSEEV